MTIKKARRNGGHRGWSAGQVFSWLSGSQGMGEMTLRDILAEQTSAQNTPTTLQQNRGLEGLWIWGGSYEIGWTNNYGKNGGVGSLPYPLSSPVLPRCPQQDDSKMVHVRTLGYHYASRSVHFSAPPCSVCQPELTQVVRMTTSSPQQFLHLT